MPMPAASAQDHYSRQPIQASNAGVIAGVLGIVFGLFGIFTIGFIFVPLAAICSVIGVLRGIGGFSLVGIGLSLVGGALTVAGFVLSPTLWLLAGAGVIAGAGALAVASHEAATPSLPSPANRLEIRSANEIGDPAFLVRLNGLLAYVSEVEPKLNTAKSISDDLRARFQGTLDRIGEYKQAYPRFSHPYSVTASQLAFNLNSQVTKDRMAQVQLAQIDNEWTTKIPRRLDEITQISSTCMSLNNEQMKNAVLSAACANILAVNTGFRAAASSTKSSIDGAEGAYQAELKVSENIYR